MAVDLAVHPVQVQGRGAADLLQSRWETPRLQHFEGMHLCMGDGAGGAVE